MTQISNDTEFRTALDGLDPAQQRLVAARFVENVVALCSDDRIARVIQVAGNSEASESELAEALKTARATTFDCHTRCGSEGDWTEQEGYFVARAAVAALTPAGKMPSGPAWQAALSSRMAQTSRSIVTGDDTAGQEGNQQYRILSEFLDS
ncbi:MAG: hypothetical protein DRQ45_05975 [Gammaproteobacteria bacterium]|nr:MAG: hypothetical protein DRQ45_05975 [Gammaproteobacteria bacterium]